jgi:uncharacterized membrane protein
MLWGIAGSAMLLWGLKRRSFFGGLLSLAGTNLIVRSLGGHSLLETAGVTSFTPTGARAVVPHQLGLQVREAITVNLPPEDIYQFVRDFENLPLFLNRMKSVVVQDDRHASWSFVTSVGSTQEFDVEIFTDVPGKVISWRTVNCRFVDGAGAMRLEQARRGTIVHVSLQYMPTAGSIGGAISKLLGHDPELELKRDLRQLKQMLETGEIATTKRQPAGGYLRPSIRHSHPYAERSAEGRAAGVPPIASAGPDSSAKSRSAAAG